MTTSQGTAEGLVVTLTCPTVALHVDDPTLGTGETTPLTGTQPMWGSDWPVCGPHYGTPHEQSDIWFGTAERTYGKMLPATD